MSEVGQKNQPKKNRPFFTTLYLYYFVKKRPTITLKDNPTPLPHNDIITQIQTLVQDTRHISLILSLFIKWTVVQNVNMMSEHNMSLCHNATFLFIYQMESCSNLTTWQLDNLTTWQPDNTLTVARVCLSFRHFCTLNANPYTQFHDYSDNYLDVYSDNYLDDYSDNYLDDYCYDYREACTLNLIYQFHLWKQSFPCYILTLEIPGGCRMFSGFGQSLSVEFNVLAGKFEAYYY